MTGQDDLNRVRLEEIEALRNRINKIYEVLENNLTKDEFTFIKQLIEN